MLTVNDLQISLSSKKNFLVLLACTRTFLSFSPFNRQKKSWDVPNLELPVDVCYGSIFGVRNVVGVRSTVHNKEIMTV